MKNQVQLIAYAHRFGGGGIAELSSLLHGPLRGLFGAVHLLPFFYPIDGSDAGFDPIDHTQVDPQLGGWGDVKALARDIDVMADVIVNHMSADSAQFRDYSKHGAASQFDGLFLTREAVFPNGATEADQEAIYRPRPGLPFTNLMLENGERRVLWTTFSDKQIDINVRHPTGVAYLERILKLFSDQGIRIVRLDAVGYAIKKPGTSCFMIPDTFDFIAEFGARAQSLGMEVVVEIHSYYRKQIEIAAHAQWVYDFALPPLLLHAFAFGTAKYLKEWIGLRPTNALTVLDTHDGIGVIDIGAVRGDHAARPGLVPAEELDRLVEIIHGNSHNQSRLATGAAASNLDLYQINCTYYEAMGRDDQRYLLARAIQFFLPGIPQVYYVGLLAGLNDMALLERTGVGRDINRPYYSRAEIALALKRPVVRALCALIQFRNAHSAFSGQFTLMRSDDSSVCLRWDHGPEFAQLRVEFDNAQFDFSHSTAGGVGVFKFDMDPTGAQPQP